MTPPTNPHAELVEALRKTNGWLQTSDSEDEFRCAWGKCPDVRSDDDGPPPIQMHDRTCVCRRALEYTPPPAPKLTPLPIPKQPIETVENCWRRSHDWINENRQAIIASQETPVEQHNVENAPTRGEVDELRRRMLCAENTITILTAQLESLTNQRSSDRGSMSDLAIRFQEIENRLNKLEQSERIHESNQNVILETVKALAGTECPCDQTSDDFCDLVKRVDALESKPDIMTWLPSVLKDTDMRTRELERKRPYTTEWRELTDRLDALESRTPPQSPDKSKLKPACDKCGDTKIISETKQLHFNHSITDHKLCSCLSVGDVVTAEVANLLPVGSVIAALGDYTWERTTDGWMGSDGIPHPTGIMKSNDWPILRIGPAPTSGTFAAQEKSDAEFIARCRGRTPTSDDAHPTNCACPDCEPDETYERVGEREAIAAVLDHAADISPDHVADASKKVATVEEIAREICDERGLVLDGSTGECVIRILRRHGIGRAPTLAEKLADPELRGVVEVVKKSFDLNRRFSICGHDLNEKPFLAAVDALSHELRAALAGVQ